MVSIINVGSGNFNSVANIVKKLGHKVELVSDYDKVSNSKIIILPGVGRFDIFMDKIRNTKIDKAIFVKAENISQKLKGLKWLTSNYNGKLEVEINLLQESINFLRLNKKNSVIITYYQFINSELDHEIYSPNRWYTSDGASYPLKKNKFHEKYLNFFKNKLLEKKIKKIFTIKPLDKDVFVFLLKSNCVQTLKINDILSEHDITNCFAKKN